VTAIAPDPVRELATALAFPEGPVALSDGSVLVVDIGAGTVTIIPADEEARALAHVGGGPNGAAIGPDGAVYIANNGGFLWTERHGRRIPIDPTTHTNEPPNFGGGWIERVDRSTGDSTVGWIYFVGRDNDWFRVDGENFSARPVKRIVGHPPAVRSAAAFAVPDTAAGDRVMVAVELHEGRAFDAADFDVFLDQHPDLSPTWRPGFVRIVDSLPVLASLKVDKRTLRREAWECEGPVWWRSTRHGELTLLDPDAAEGMSSLLFRSNPSSV
jgi:acyl-CoA synthetase (AMP-forming)/AMP-acid ligase II